VLTLTAPAKINLTLEVLSKRADGFHEVRSVLQAVSLCDTLSFEPAEELHFHCEDPAWQAEKSLVVRAAEKLRERTGVALGAVVNIFKDIPLSSGLGGDSSDAAAVLTGLDRLWKPGVPPDELAAVAAELGSDVPFFLGGWTALASGRGEIVSPLPGLPPAWVIILMPKVEIPKSKTADLYSRIKTAHFTDGSVTEAMVARIKRGKKIAPSDLYNVFEKVAYDAFQGLKKYRDDFQEAVESPVHLAGAGPSLFAFAHDWEQSVRVVSSLREKGLEALVSRTLNSPRL
jgi:4-diphosphocytidyl-2-C-methyl-D-erythritol kinase